jgi:type VI secretion system secreted protein Hcp
MADDIYLDIAEIKGELAEPDGKIKVLSFQFGVSNAVSSRRGSGGGGAGEASFSDVTIVGELDLSGPKLADCCAKGTVLKKATLVQRRQGETQVEMHKMILEDVLVSSYAISGGSGGGLPNSSFSLNFGKIDWKYTQQLGTGKTGANSPFKFDVTKGKA